MAAFTGSSQQKHWLFPSKEALAQSSAKQCIKVKQEMLDHFRSICTLRLLNLCRLYSMPIEVEATAATYFRRFFLYQSFSETDRQGHSIEAISHACILLACKTCEFRIPPDRTDRFVAVKPVEPMVLAGLRFQLQVHHPYLALEGFLLQWMEMAPALADCIQVAKLDVHAAVRDSLLTDMNLRFTPAQIALAALQQLLSPSSTVEKKVKISLEQFILKVICKNDKSLVAKLANVATDLHQFRAHHTEKELMEAGNSVPFQRFEAKLLGSAKKTSKKRQRSGQAAE